MKASISRFIFGAIILGAGVALLLDTLGVVDTSFIFEDWWPLAVVLGGVIILVNDVKNYLWALLVMSFGVIAQLRVLDYIDVNPWQAFWPVVLIAVGLSIVFKRPALPGKTSDDSSDDIVAILGGSDQKNSSNDFKSSQVTTIMGGAKIDLHKATIKKSATIEVFVLMGGVEIVVPRGVVINNQTNAILGGAENKADQDVAKDPPTLTIVGDIILGGIEIKN